MISIITAILVSGTYAATAWSTGNMSDIMSHDVGNVHEQSHTDSDLGEQPIKMTYHSLGLEGHGLPIVPKATSTS
jgi:hypothetical protein